MGSIKVLMLGASQYGWEKIDLEEASKNGYYYAKSLDTCGSFAFALNMEIANEIIEEALHFNGPFDHIPLGQIYERYPQECYVAFPNIVIPDVTHSHIREGRDQVKHADTMKWDLSRFGFPAERKTIGLLMNQNTCLRSIPEDDFNVDIRCYRATKDGLRPIHTEEQCQSANIQETGGAELRIEWLSKLYLDEVFELDRSAHGAEIALEILGRRDRFAVDDDRSSEWLKKIEYTHAKSRKGGSAVIIPTKGRTEALRLAVESVAKQDYPDNEIIVVDDNGEGSELSGFIDELVNRTQDKGVDIKLIRHSRSRNSAAARNTGLLATDAEFVSFLDDDDIYLNGRLGLVIEKLATADTDVGAVYCGYLGWNSNQNNDERYPKDNMVRRLLNLEFSTHYACTDTVTYRREKILSINGYNESYERHQDLELNIRFFSRFDVEVVPEALVQLNPLPADQANKIYDVDLFVVKQKFIDEFMGQIRTLKLDEDAILRSHVKEMQNFTRDRDMVLEFALSHPSVFSSAYIRSVLAEFKCAD